MNKKIKDLLKYPRPLLRRDNFISLNGEWDFYFENADVGIRKPRYIEFPKDHLKINVPFAYQAPASGVEDKSRHDEVYYHKCFSFPHKEDERVIFHIGAADYITYLYVNGEFVGKHQGGYCAFSFDITSFLIDDKADIVIRCLDSYSIHQPRGKQKWKDNNFGCWYQEITGIWKNVWVEIVKDTYITNLRLTPVEGGYIDIDVTLSNSEYKGQYHIEVKLHNEVVAISSDYVIKDKIKETLKLHKVEYWDVLNPTLYDVDIYLDNKEHVSSIFGYRFIKTNNGKIYLNDKELFMRLTLEQGYYPRGIYTFFDEDEIINEVNLIKDYGFNGLRMHQKVEDERFYYLCDLMGLIVWSEMPSSYDFDDETENNTIREWKEILNEHYNHPSILVWTPCNESWGVPGIKTTKEQQAFLNKLYDITKEFDKTRLVVSNDGWEHCKTDLVTLHNYYQDPDKLQKYFVDDIDNILKENKLIDISGEHYPFADGYRYEGQPVLLDEFAGIGFNIDDVSNGWGYGNSVKSEEEFLKRYDGLISAIRKSGKFAGWCMTQISDVYQEVNGLVTLDRRHKFDIKKVARINKK